MSSSTICEALRAPLLDNVEVAPQVKLPEGIVSALSVGQMTARHAEGKWEDPELLSATSSGGWWQKLLRSSS